MKVMSGSHFFTNGRECIAGCFFFGSNETLTLISQEKQADLLPKLKEKISTPEGVPRLFDLVRVQDERMKLAFYAALRNTVVAKDLDQVYFNFCNDLLYVGEFYFVLKITPNLFLI